MASSSEAFFISKSILMPTNTLCFSKTKKNHNFGKTQLSSLSIKNFRKM